MGLPKIKFIIASNGLELLTADIQKTPGLVVTGSTVAGKIAIGESKQIFSLEDAKKIGITEGEKSVYWVFLKNLPEALLSVEVSMQIQTRL